MKIAAYNIENLFDRAKAFNEETAEADRIVKLESHLNRLFNKKEYTAADKKKMLEIMEELGILKKDDSKFVWLRKIRGEFIKRPRTGSPEIIATGRDSWVGWVELKTAPVNEIAIMNTGRVIRDVNADILAVVEAEHRVALKQFSDYVLEKVNGHPYANIMLIDGNNDRGIDVGLMTKQNFEITLMRSHVHDKDDTTGQVIFSRDCPEYCVVTPNGEYIWILPNHFKSKYGGNDQQSKNKRKLQSERVAFIYNRLRSEGYDLIVVLGDLNDTPNSNELKPLLADTDLKDVSEHSTFDTGEFAGKGTFGLGNDSNKIDYLLLSPALFERIIACGLFRKGAWPGKNPKRWTVYDELTEEKHVASDHHVVWCEIS